MKLTIKKLSFIFIMFALFSLFALIGCGEDNPSDNKKLLNTYLDTAELPEEVKAFAFDYSKIKIVESYDDGTEVSHEITKDNFDLDNLTKLNKIGAHNIELTYNEKKYNFNVTVIKNEDVSYKLTEFNIVIDVVENKYVVNINTNIEDYKFDYELVNDETLNYMNFKSTIDDIFDITDLKVTLKVCNKNIAVPSKTSESRNINLTFPDELWSELK